MEKYVLILIICANITTAIYHLPGGKLRHPRDFFRGVKYNGPPPLSNGPSISSPSTLTVYKPMTANIQANLSEFESTIYSKVASQNVGQNIVMAPYFINVAMVLLLIGASGSTLTELKNGLFLPKSNKLDLATRYLNTLAPLESNHQLSILNGMFIGNNFDIQQSYSVLGGTNFFTNVTNINFAQTKNVVNSINSWATANTAGRIKTVVNSQLLSHNDEMVLVNAVHYQGIWQIPIHKSDTKMHKFYSNDLCHHSNAQNVKMMSTKSNFDYGNLTSLEAEVVELPLWSSNLTLTIILPWKCGGLSELENKLSKLGLSVLENQLQLEGEFMVDVTFPKFEIAFNESLKNALTSMNMDGIFSEGANFNEILEPNGNSIQVNDVIHKSIISVTEGGPPGSPANCNRCVNPGVPDENTKTIIADHPFVFMVRKFSNIIMIGRYIN